MICYRDTTFCVSTGCENKCGRQLTKEIEDAAKDWWKTPNNPTGEGAPIAMSCFCGGDLREAVEERRKHND